MKTILKKMLSKIWRPNRLSAPLCSLYPDDFVMTTYSVGPNEETKNDNQEYTIKNMSKDPNTLLPCPFCGKHPEYKRQCESELHPGNYWPHQIVHNCKTINVNFCVRAEGGRTETPKEVFRMWNTRFTNGVETTDWLSIYL